MAYKFDPLKYKKTFDGMFGSGSYDKGISRARETGTKIGEAKLLRRQMEEERRERERLEKELAKKEKEAAEKEKEGKSKKEKENDNLKRRIEASGGDTEKKQSAFGKAANLDPDNNMFFDALDLMSRPLNAVMNVGKREEERKKKKSTKDKYLEEMSSKPIWETGLKGKLDVLKDQFGAAKEGFSGEEKTLGGDVLGEAGMEKGWKRGALGFAMDVAVDPLNVVGALPAKVVGKGAGAVNKGLRKSDTISKGMDAVGDVFSNKRAMRETLNPKVQTGALEELNNTLHSTRSQLIDKSLTDVVKARRTAGRKAGTQVGQVMEEPLSRAGRNLDITAAPNVLDTGRAMRGADTALQGATNPLSPLARFGGLDTKTTVTSKIGDLPDPTNKEVKAWLRENGLPGGARGKVSQANLDLYKAENAQSLRTSFQVETKVRNVLSSTSDVEQAAKTLTKEPAIRNNIRQAADKLVNSNAALREFAAKNNIQIGDLEGYMAHFATKEAQKFLKENGDVISSGAGRIGGDERVLTRKMNDTVKNTNTLMKQKTGVDEFFTPDAFLATAGGQHRVVNYIVAEMAKDQILKNGDLARPMRQGAKARPGYKQLDINGKTYEMTKGAAQTIQRYEKMVNDENINKFLKGYDKMLGMWKKGALFSVGYHARNMMGNTFNMAMSDMNPATAMAKQLKSGEYLHQLKNARHGGKPLPKGFPRKVAEQYEEFISTGLRATGVGVEFADETAEKAMNEVAYRSKGILGKAVHEPMEALRTKGAGAKAKALVNAPFEQSRRVGDEADEIARFTLYRHLRDKGMGPEKATNRVKEVLYDYSDLTNVERELFKRMAPFYTFTRKNIEFQAKNFLQNPAKYNQFNNLIKEGYANSDMDEEIVPDYLKDALAVPVGDGLLNAGLPGADLARMSDPLGMATDMLTPALKVPLELSTNQKMFSGAPIEEYEGQSGDIFGMEVPKKLEYAAQSAFVPMRNMAGAQQQVEEGATPQDTLLKAMGGQLIKPYDEEAFQTQADYKENERLQGIKSKMEKEEGQEVYTLKEMRDMGMSTTEEEDLLEKEGYNASQRAAIMTLRKKVDSGDETTAAQALAIMESRGFSQDIIDYVLNQ